MIPPLEPSREPGKTQVPGQLLGYGLQYTRMLSLLLESQSHDTVSLEVFEDVGVHTEDATIASQTKSSLTDNPVANRADPFWKTLGNWLDAVKTGQLSLKDTVFELYVFGDFEGEICSTFSNAKTEAEAKLAISKAKELLLAPKIKVSDRIKKVLDADEEKLVSLVVHFRYRHGSGASIDDLKKQLGVALIPPEYIENVLIHCVGWVKKEADTLIENGQPAAIRVIDFRNEVSTYTRMLIFSACFADLAGPALPDDVENSRSRRYVRQLELIDVTEERKLRAITAFLRSSVNRAEWGRLGSVHESSLDDFEMRLIDYWQNSKTQCEISLKDRTVVERGQYVLAECMKCNSALQGRTVPHDFLEGCFHALADELAVGWHPEFEKLTAEWK